MGGKKRSKPKAIINPMKFTVKTKKKEIKNEHIKEIFKLLHLDCDSNNNSLSEEKEIKNEDKHIEVKKSKESVKKEKKKDNKEKENNKNKDSEYKEKNSTDSEESNSYSFEKLISELSLESKDKPKIDKQQKENKKTKAESENKNKINNSNKSNPKFIIKYIQKDGNCFYRTLSYFYRETEDAHAEFRQIISNYIINNPDEYIFAVTDEDIHADDNMGDDIKLLKKREYIIKYGNTASKDKEWAGNIEIATACSLLNVNIIMYTLNENGYQLFHKYGSEEVDEQNKNKAIINILFINQNHFNLLLPFENDSSSNRSCVEKNINLQEFEKILLDDKIKHKRKIDDKIKFKNKQKIYVEFPKYNLKNYYNEIYVYLTENIMPKRLEYSKDKNRKTMEKKRGKFRKLIKEKYRISNNRLQYSYYYKNKLLWLNIIYEEEKIPLLKYTHFSNNHIKRETMDEKIIEMGFYWFGYSSDILELIRNCGVCHSENVGIKLPNNPKIIISYGPNKRYQCDLWYLPDNLKENTFFEYCLDIIDHFSKWLGSYLLKNKTAELVVSKIRAFFRDNGVCEIFQTDNGKEFNNTILKTFLDNNNVNYLRSAPYHPQTNGCCEAVHKEIKNYLLRKKELLKESFDLEIALEEAIDFHNNRIIKSTGYKPIDLRHNEEKNIIDTVNKNIINSMKRKLTNKHKIPKNTLLLICTDIDLLNNVYVLKKHKVKKIFSIPAIFIKYHNSNTIFAKIMVNINNEVTLKKGDVLKFACETCRIIDDFGFHFYLKQNGENIEIENLKKLALLED